MGNSDFIATEIERSGGGKGAQSKIERVIELWVGESRKRETWSGGWHRFYCGRRRRRRGRNRPWGRRRWRRRRRRRCSPRRRRLRRRGKGRRLRGREFARPHDPHGRAQRKQAQAQTQTQTQAQGQAADVGGGGCGGGGGGGRGAEGGVDGGDDPAVAGGRGDGARGLACRAKAVPPTPIPAASLASFSFSLSSAPLSFSGLPVASNRSLPFLSSPQDPCLQSISEELFGFPLEPPLDFCCDS